MITKGIFSHKSDHWSTPVDVYDFFMSRGFYDPCPLNADFDGLSLSVVWGDRVYCNPPYSNILAWVERCISSCVSGSLVVMLLPVRTDTKWFSLLLDYRCTFYFVRGRMKFGGSKAGAPFPSMFVVLEPGKSGCTKVFGGLVSYILCDIDEKYMGK